MITKKGEKGGTDNNDLYYCIHCDYKACDNYKFTRHLLTPKHLNLTNDNGMLMKKGGFIKGVFNCECGKEYKYQSSLCRHKKSCNTLTLIKTENNSDNIKINNNNNNNNNNNDNNDNNNNNEINYKELIFNLINQNKELQEAMINQNKELQDVIINQNKELQETMINQSNEYQKTLNEIIPKIGNNNNNNNTINNNQKFNINVFLNENCKDAITMDNFLNSMQVSLTDLFFTREKGLAEGLTNIIIESMNKLPLTQRPMHCTDVKRETIYIKNEKWEKDENKEKIKHVLQRVSNIQIKNIHKFKEAKPNCMKNSKEKDEYMEIIKATTDDVTEREDKIIRNLCKSSYVNEKIFSDTFS